MMADAKPVEKSGRNAQAYEDSLLSFFSRLVGFSLALVSLFVLFFGSPLVDQPVIGSSSAPSAILLALLTALILGLFRPLASKIASSRALAAVHIVAALGTGIAPFALIVPTLRIPALAAIALGIAAGSFAWCLALCDFGHKLLTVLTSSAFAIAAGATCLILELSPSNPATLSVECICALCSLVILGRGNASRGVQLLSVCSERSKTRATTAKCDRWTYATIGVDLGFAAGTIVFSGYSWHTDSPLGALFESSLFAVIPIAITGVLLFTLRTRFSFTFENRTKDYLSSCVALCALLPIVTPHECGTVFFSLLLLISCVQVSIVVSASIEFIRIENLSPAWYMAEASFTVWGMAFGLLLGCTAGCEADGLPLMPLCCILVVIFNVFAQPHINKGAYPTPKRSTLKPPPRQVLRRSQFQALQPAKTKQQMPAKALQSLLEPTPPPLQLRKTVGKRKSPCLPLNTA